MRISRYNSKERGGKKDKIARLEQNKLFAVDGRRGKGMKSGGGYQKSGNDVVVKALSCQGLSF
jgi:hypothetical protein